MDWISHRTTPERLATFVLFLALACSAHMSFAQRSGDDPNVTVNPALFADLEYRMIGPTRGGRVTAVAGHADQTHTFYMGATGGGVWKTTDAGVSWQNISDGYFDTGSIGSIDVSDSNPDVVYVGTGSDGIRSNVIIGKGVYKSEDAGETWTHVGLERVGQIGAVVVHPTNPEVVYVAALGSPFGPNPERGVFKTTDGGASWDHVLFVSNRTGAIDLELNPVDPDEVYAALWFAERKPWTIISGDDKEDGFYKSIDGGATWSKIERGLPQGLIGKIDLAVSADDPSRIYALVEAPTVEEGLYRSNDRGASWNLVNTQRGLMNRPFYYTNVDADPSNADVVYVNNEGFYKSSDAGRQFARVSTPHGDNHDMWINPIDPKIFVQSNDGGANVTLNGGGTWSTQNNQATAELYQVHLDDRFPYWAYAGQQDNSTIAVPSLPPRGMPGGQTSYWESIGGCETGPAIPKPGDPDIVYSNCKGRFGRFNRRTGQEQQYYVGAVDLYGRNPSELPYRFQRVVPIHVSPHDPGTVYHGSQYVHRTRDEGRTWETISPDLTAFRPERQMASGGPITRDITGEEHYSTLYVIEESPVEKGVIWTGSNDGPVHVSRDDGQTWTDVTPPSMPPEGRIQNIDPSPHSGGKAYVAGYRYLLNDFKPYIYRTMDYGRTWTLLTDGSNGIPDDFPTRVVREDPDREGLLYAGTEFGMFISFDDGGHWQPFQKNLPVTPVTDIKVHEQDLVLSTMGRSFWILDNVTPLHQIDQLSADVDRYLFQPRKAFRLRRGGSGAGNGSSPEYAPAGAAIDFYLSQSADDGMMLEVLDATGAVIRTIKNQDATEEESAVQGMRGPVARVRGSSPLEGESGMHRFIWDMRHMGPRDEEGNSGRGPLAVPGTYTVRLTVGDWVSERPVDLLTDPRVAEDGVSVSDMEAQLALNLRIVDMQTRANQTLARIDSAITALEPSVKSGSEIDRELDKKIGEIRAAMVTDRSDSYPPPMLIDQIGYLRSMISSADQRPGSDAYRRFEDLRIELDTHIDNLERLLLGVDVQEAAN